jgi:hypothetical protein
MTATGQYRTKHGGLHGFLYEIGAAKFARLDAPGASVTQAWGIDNNDNVAVSSDVGNFVYCIKAKNCPGAGADAVKRVPGKIALP